MNARVMTGLLRELTLLVNITVEKSLPVWQEHPECTLNRNTRNNKCNVIYFFFIKNKKFSFSLYNFFCNGVQIRHKTTPVMRALYTATDSCIVNERHALALHATLHSSDIMDTSSQTWAFISHFPVFLCLFDLELKPINKMCYL